MRSTTLARPLIAVMLAISFGGVVPVEAANGTPGEADARRADAAITVREQAIVPIAAFAATGDIARLGAALEQGLDAGMTVSDAREVLVQVYAYAGFPRSLNALGELMRVLEARRARGIEDVPGRGPAKPIPKGDALLAAGTANQTKLVGVPVKGALFEFAPAMDEFLKTHLFGDIFERDNISWPDREIATIAMLAALPGVESQLRSHIAIGKNAGLSVEQLQSLVRILDQRVGPEVAGRARAALQAQPR